MGRKLQLDSAIAADIQTVNADSYIDSLKMIDIENIEPNRNNFYENSEIEALADDIERQGLMTALVVSEHNGKYELISGHRRLAAIKSLIADGRRRSGKVPCFIKGAKPNTETELDLIMLNATQRKYSDADTMREYEELTRIFKELEAAGKPVKGRIRDKIADALNVSPAQVGKLDNIKHNAIPDVEQAVKSGDMSISTANEVAKLAPEKQQDKDSIAHLPRQNNKFADSLMAELDKAGIKYQAKVEGTTTISVTLFQSPMKLCRGSQNRRTIFFLTIPPRAFSSTFSASLRKIMLLGNKHRLQLPIRIHRL